MNKTKKLLAMMLVVVLSISIIPTTNVSAAKKVKLNKTKATIYVGKTVTLKLNNNKKKVKWTTSNKKVATVSKKGKVKGKKAGKATITAKVGKKKYKCKVTVKVATPKLNKTKETIDVGKTVTLKVENNKKKVTWSSSDKKVATVTSKGIVKGIKAGKATITAKVGKKKYKCTVTVKQSTKPAEQPTTKPTEQPTTKPSDPSIIIPEGYDKNDAEALIKIIEEQRAQGSNISTDITNEDEYTWKEGKLVRIIWDSKILKGKLDVTGLTSLITLDCDCTGITDLDVSKNVALKYLYCWSTNLKSIDVSNNIELKELNLNSCSITELDVTNNINLTMLGVSHNSLSKLDVTKNVNLTNLYCMDLLRLTELDLSNNTQLKVLSCSYTSIANLDVSKNTLLEALDCYEVPITELDVTNNTLLTDLQCDKTLKVIGYSNNPQDEN